MSSIQKINLASLNTNLAPIHQNKETKAPQNLTYDNNLLSNHLNRISRNNLYLVSFGTGLEWVRPGWAYQDFCIQVPKDGTGLRKETRDSIQFEAANRISNYYKWPEIKTINAWMVSAETDKFMSIGGLAKVADDLPTSFNKHFDGKTNDKMTIVTPLYTDGDKYQLQTDPKNKTITYKSGKQEIKLKKLTDIDVEVFDEIPNGHKKEWKTTTRKVDVYTGNKNGTPYIMFDDKDIFNVTPNTKDKDAIEKNANSAGCYVTNEKGYDENFRFAFFSKCVYELAKKLKETESAKNTTTNVTAPNIMVLNDWHVGPVAPLMKYLAKAEKEKGEISKDVKDYFEETPTLFIAHNLGYQGSICKNNKTEGARAKVLGTLFGKYTKTIIENSRNIENLPEEDMNALFKYSNLNPGMMGLALCDRIVPVSVNYGDELLESSDIANGMQNLLQKRNQYSTFTPITNGYAKSLVTPNESNIENWLKRTAEDLKINGEESIKTKDIRLKPYTVDNIISARKHNKKEVFKLLNRIIERERNCAEANYNSIADTNTNRKYMLYKPNETDLSDIKDPTKVPVMTFVGRVASQKGMNTIFKKAILDFAKDYTEEQKSGNPNGKYKDWEVPVILIGGTVAEKNCLKELEDLKNQLKEINPEFAKRMLLFKGYANTNMLAMGTDFFLIPSNFEPCGLIQMEVMAKGVLPIASATGGLVSTINDTYDGFLSTVFYDKSDSINPNEKNHGQKIYTGQKVKPAPPTNWQGFKAAMEKALYTYNKMPNRLIKMQKTAMNKDFSWDAKDGALDKYVSLMKTGQCKLDRISYFDKPDSDDRKAFSEHFLATL